MVPLGREAVRLRPYQPAIGCRLFPGARTCCFHQGQRSGEGDTLEALQKPSEVSGEKGQVEGVSPDGGDLGIRAVWLRSSGKNLTGQTAFWEHLCGAELEASKRRVLSGFWQPSPCLVKASSQLP